MAENFSFDVVSDFDRQELVNALDQVKREVSQRYDLKGTDTSLDLEKENIFLTTNNEFTLNSVIDIIRQKAIKRNLSLKIFDYKSIEVVSGNKVKQTITLKKGINQEIAKKISKKIRDEFKKVNVSINGETLRVTSKSKNDLQLIIKLLDNLEDKFKIDVGYSDHTMGDEILIYSYLSGAKIIEKHFSNSIKKKTFRDHSISLNKKLVDRFLIKIKEISLYLKVKKEITKSEKNQNNLYSFRRSVFARKDIKKNDNFSEKNLICLRPYLNNSSKKYFELIKKKSKKKYQKGDLIKV